MALGAYLRKYEGGVNILAVYLDDNVQTNVRELRIVERPAHQIINVTVYDNPGDGWKDKLIGVETTSITLNDRIVGVFESAYVLHLPKFPFLKIGCIFSIDQTRRKCDAGFITERLPIESRPKIVDRSIYDSPVSVLLGIKKLSGQEIENFTDSVVDGGSDSSRPAPGEDAAFNALHEIVGGQNPSMSWIMAYLIANNPARLAPFAMGMTERFVELSRRNGGDFPGRREQAALLASGIAALKESDFSAVKKHLADFVRTDGVSDEFPLLFLRLADADMYSIYRDRFLASNATKSDRLMAALAICRIGQGDAELISELKSQWLNMESDPGSDTVYKTGLFVTLLALGQENQLRSTIRSDSSILRAWFEAVLAGQGNTKVGPNNCMPAVWERPEYLPPVLAPSLRWSKQKWDLASVQ